MRCRRVIPRRNHGLTAVGSRSIAGFDTALWDLVGKRAGKYVSELVGGSNADVPVYGSSLDRESTPQQIVAKLQNLHDNYGVDAFKIKVAIRMGNGSMEHYTRDQVRTLARPLRHHLELMTPR